MRTLPAHPEAERAVVGGILVAPDCLDLVALRLSASDFSDDRLRHIYESMLALRAKGAPLDPLTIYDAAKARGPVGTPGEDDGLAWLTDLMESTPSAHNVEYWADTVRDAGVLRRGYAACAKGAEQLRNPMMPAADILADIGAALEACQDGKKADDVVCAADLAREVHAAREAVRRGTGTIAGRPTGLACLDRTLLGLAPGGVYLIAGRPSMGKSAIGWQFAVYFAKLHAGPVIWFSLEMSGAELVLRYLAADTGIELTRIQKGPRANVPPTADEEDALTLSLQRYSCLPLYVCSEGSLTPADIRTRVRALVRRAKAPPALVGIDYAQLVSGRGDNREQAVASVSRACKALAKETGCPVLLLSQLNRKAAEGAEPQLSDLRESGALEQDADAVLFLSGKIADPRRTLTIAKQRAGETGACDLDWSRGTMRFTDPDARQDDPLAPAVASYYETEDRE